jgi:hypothetical protein
MSNLIKRTQGWDVPVLEGGGAGAGMAARSAPRQPEKRSPKDHKEKADREPELTGEVSFGSPRRRSADSGDRTPMTSDDYKKGGKVRSASARADGIATKGKTRGKIVMCGGGMYKK